MKHCKFYLSAIVVGLIGTTTTAGLSIGDQRNFEGGTDGAAFNTGVYNINTNALVEDDGSAQSPYNLDGITPTTETKGVVLNNSSASNSPRFGADITDYDETVTQYIQFDFKATAIPHNASIEIREGANNTGTQGILIGLLANSGNITNRESGGFVNAFGSPVNLSLDTWYRYTITINPINGGADTYDLRVQSIESTAFDQTATGLIFRNNIGDINSFNIFANVGSSSTGDVFAVDNVRVVNNAGSLNFDVIPEPNSLALLSLGGLMMIKRRRRNYVV